MSKTQRKPRRAPQDATMRNVRASVGRDLALTGRVAELGLRIKALSAQVEALEATFLRHLDSLVRADLRIVERIHALEQRAGEVSSPKLVKLAQQYMAQHRDASFRDAIIEVSAKHPKLAAQYRAAFQL